MQKADKESIQKALDSKNKCSRKNERSSVESWAFINQLSLMLVYRIYNKLHEYGLTKKYSVADFLEYLKYIRKVKINNVWHTGEITKASQTLLDKMNIDIT